MTSKKPKSKSKAKMKIYKINANTDFNELCKHIKPHKIGQKMMSEKSKIHFFLLKDISSPAANILKQDALSVGAELVSHKDTILGQGANSKALLMATSSQIQRLIEKESKQDFKLKELANFLSQNFKKPQKPKLMAVLNINDDSFNPASRVKGAEFKERLESVLALKPDFVDIGAVSSRPGSLYCGSDEEFKRLKETLDLIYKNNYYEKSVFSLDSFDEKSLDYALNKGFKLINDITGLKNEALARLAKTYNASYCLMHIQNEPHNMQDNPHYNDLLGEIDEFFRTKLEILENYGVKDVILDVGIGFGKTAHHNMLLIKHLEHFLHFEKPLLVGASRKSVVNAYFPSEVKDRLAGSLYLHLKAFENGASIIRTHDLYEHKQAFALNSAMKGLGYE